jgi:hypothetical protein
MTHKAMRTELALSLWTQELDMAKWRALNNLLTEKLGRTRVYTVIMKEPFYAETSQPDYGMTDLVFDLLLC